MADVIKLIEGFDHLSQGQFTRKGYNANPSGVQSGRFGGQAGEFSSNTGFGYTFGTASQAWRIGFAYKANTHNGAALDIIQLFDGGTCHITLGFDGSRKPQITRNGTQIGVASTPFNMSTWYYWEFYIVISDSISSGHGTLKIDGATSISLSAATDTRNGGNASADRFFIVFSGSNNHLIDDLVVSYMDVTTTPTFLGDNRVITLYPSGDGNYSQFTGSDGNSVNNSLLVDEAQTNDADYVQSSTASDRDSYAFDNLPITPSAIRAVQISPTVLKDDAGSRTGKSFFRISGTDYDQASAFSPATSASVPVNLLELSPATSSVWTKSEIDGMEAGIKVES